MAYDPIKDLGVNPSNFLAQKIQKLQDRVQMIKSPTPSGEIGPFQIPPHMMGGQAQANNGGVAPTNQSPVPVQTPSPSQIQAPQAVGQFGVVPTEVNPQQAPAEADPASEEIPINGFAYLGKKVRDKHPEREGYSDISDEEIGKQTIEKYPQYQHFIEEGNKMAGIKPKQGFGDFMAESFSQFADPTVETIKSLIGIGGKQVDLTKKLASGEMNKGDYGIQSIGNISNVIAAPVEGAINSFVKAFVPEDVQKSGADGVKSFMENTDVGQSFSATMDTYKKFAEKHPEATDDAAAILNGALNLLGLGEGKALLKQGGEQAIKGALQSTEEAGISLLKKGKSLIPEKAPVILKTGEDVMSNKGARNMWETISPDMNKAEISSRAKSGLGTTKGITKETIYKPHDYEVPLINTAEEAGVKSGDIVSNNISKVKAANRAEQQSLRAEIKGKPYTYTPVELESRLNKIEVPPLLTSDQTLERAYNIAKQRFLDISKKYKGNMDGLLSTRQEFDDWVRKNMGDIYSNDRYSPMKSAIKDMRNTANDMINEKIGDNFVKDSLAKQSRLYEIEDNLSSKAEKVGTKIFDRSPTAKSAKDIGKRALLYGGSAAIGIGGYEGLKSIVE